MAEFELGHPFAQDVEKIHTAIHIGFLTVDQITQKSPELKVYYEDPLEYSTGIATIHVADWGTENHSEIYLPFVVDPEDMTWQVECEEGRLPVRQRITTTDILGRGFKVKLDGEYIVTPYMQVDVVDEGLVFSVRNGQNITVAYGAYEGQTYDSVSGYMSSVTGIAKLSRLVDIS